RRIGVDLRDPEPLFEQIPAMPRILRFGGGEALQKCGAFPISADGAVILSAEAKHVAHPVEAETQVALQAGGGGITRSEAADDVEAFLAARTRARAVAVCDQSF